MNTTKTAVAHHQHMIARACCTADPLDELCEVILDTRPAPIGASAAAASQPRLAP